LLAPRPTPKLEDHPSSAVRDCLFDLFAATLLIGSRYLTFFFSSSVTSHTPCSSVPPFAPCTDNSSYFLFSFLCSGRSLSSVYPFFFCHSVLPFRAPFFILPTTTSRSNTLIGSFAPPTKHSPSAPPHIQKSMHMFSALFLDCLTLEGGTGRLSRNVGDQLPKYAS